MSEKSCFIIMPISDNDDYDKGHFNRVYEHLIKPAVIDAGFTPIRADNIKKTNYIIIDILKQLVECDMAVCDLSSKNPNVLYELGIRQAFDKPVTFIKDDLTDRIFDIQGFRDYEYDSSLRIDSVEKDRIKLSEIISETYECKGEDVNSIIDLLSIQKASFEKGLKLSPELSVILKSIESLEARIGQPKTRNSQQTIFDFDNSEIYDYKQFKKGDSVTHPRFGDGIIKSIEGKGRNLKGIIEFEEFGTKQLLFRFSRLSINENNKA